MFFVKMLGAALIAASSVGGGLLVSGRLIRRISELEAALRFFKALWQELSYSAAAPPELLRALQARPEFREKDYLAAALSRIEQGEPFSAAWREAVLGTALPLTQSDRALMIQIGERLGTSDLDSQLSGLGHDIEQISLTLEEARPRQRERAKLARTLGGLGGAFLVILIL